MVKAKALKIQKQISSINDTCHESEWDVLLINLKKIIILLLFHIWFSRFNDLVTQSNIMQGLHYMEKSLSKKLSLSES